MYRIVILLLGVLTLSGCASKFAYNNFDWLVYWYIDDYIELTVAQEAVFDERLAIWLARHRKEELQRYHQQLLRIKALLAHKAVASSQILAEFDVARAHWERLRKLVAPDLVDMASLLNDEQVIYLFAQLEKSHREDEEAWQRALAEKTEQQRLDDRIEKLIDRIEEFIGRATKQQKQLVSHYALQFQPTSAHWLSYRTTTQQKARQLFANRMSNQNFATELAALLTNPDQYRTVPHRQIIAQNSQLYSILMSELHASLTNKQKDKLTRKVQGIIDDLEDLMDAL